MDRVIDGEDKCEVVDLICIVVLVECDSKVIVEVNVVVPVTDGGGSSSSNNAVGRAK